MEVVVSRMGKEVRGELGARVTLINFVCINNKQTTIWSAFHGYFRKTYRLKELGKNMTRKIVKVPNTRGH